MINQRSILSLTLLVVGAGLYLHTYTLGFADLGGAFSPVFFPRIILLGWILMALLSLFVDIVSRQSSAEGKWLSVVLAIVAFFIYISLMQPIGFFFSSVLFCLAMLIISGQRRPLEIALFSVLVPGTLVLLFNHVLTMPLPVSPIFWWI